MFRIGVKRDESIVAMVLAGHSEQFGMLVYRYLPVVRAIARAHDIEAAASMEGHEDAPDHARLELLKPDAAIVISLTRRRVKPPGPYDSAEADFDLRSLTSGAVFEGHAFFLDRHVGAAVFLETAFEALQRLVFAVDEQNVVGPAFETAAEVRQLRASDFTGRIVANTTQHAI